VVLRIAVLNGAAFEWSAHEPIGRRAGLDDARLAALRAPDAAADAVLDSVADPGWTPLQRAALALTDASTRGVAVPDEVFAAVRAQLDDRGLVELVALVGGYAMVSRFLVAFAVPAGEEEVPG
jgi:4-carboxymuconolactone decarboxylase